MTVLIKRDR